MYVYALYIAYTINIYKNYKNNELLNTIMDLEIRLENMDSNTDNQESHRSNEMLRTMRMTIVGGYL